MAMNFMCYYKASAFQVTRLLGFDAIYIRIFAYRYQIFGVNLCLFLQDSSQRVQQKSFITWKKHSIGHHTQGNWNHHQSRCEERKSHALTFGLWSDKQVWVDSAQYILVFRSMPKSILRLWYYVKYTLEPSKFPDVWCIFAWRLA